MSLRGRFAPVAISGRHCRFGKAIVKMVCTDCVCSGAHCAAVGGFAALRMRRALYGRRAPCRLAACAAWILWREASRFVIARRPTADVAISGRQLRFRREYSVIQPGSARFPRRFAPRNDKPVCLAPRNHHIPSCIFCILLKLTGYFLQKY